MSLIPILIGVAIGFLLHFIIDWLFWRNKRVCTEAEINLQSAVDRLEGENGQLRAEMSDLDADIRTKNAEISRLNTDVATAQRSAAAEKELRASVGNIEQENQHLQKRVAELEGTVGDRDTEIARLRSEIAADERTMITGPNYPDNEPTVTRGASFATAQSDPTPPPPPAAPAEPDDLTKIWGIGPKIAGLLQNNGIINFAQLSQTSTARLNEILESAGSRFSLANQATWPEQAAVAAKGDWDELTKMQQRISWDQS